jgi:hypothetical protein
MLASVDFDYLPSIEYRTPKIRVLLLSIHYPFAIKNYFERALRRRDDIELITTGPYTSNWTPWLGGMSLPVKYAVPPTIPLDFPPNIGQVNYESVSVKFPVGWKPDLVLTIDAGIHFRYKPQDGYVVHVATDPHVLPYEYQRGISDKFFNMQLCYSAKGDIYLPYAYDPECHRPDDSVSKDTDAVLIGMPYPKRVEWVYALRKEGVDVIFENGPVFDEARALYNRGKIGLNWSSMDDLNARAFEISAMKLYPVMNFVSDIRRFDFLNYVQPFHSMDEAVSFVLWAKNNPDESSLLAEKSYNAVQGQTYDARVEQILRESGFVL